MPPSRRCHPLPAHHLFLTPDSNEGTPPVKRAALQRTACPKITKQSPLALFIGWWRRRLSKTPFLRNVFR